jgi:hypothetical protein
VQKRKIQPKIPLTSNIQDFLNTQDPQSLIGAIASLENSQGWELFKSFMYYQAANHVGVALALAQSTGRQQEAAASAAKAEVLREIADTFLTQLQSKIGGNEGLISEVVPQD